MNKKLLILVPLLITAPLIAQSKGKKPRGHMGHEMGQKMMVDASKITGGTYSVEKNHTLIGWRVSHFGFNDYFGIFGNPTGTLTLDKANPAKSSVTIDIPITELSTASKGLTEHMLRPGKDGKPADFFNIGEHPSAKFVSTSVQAMGQHAMINGNLTINGVTKPVTLHTNLSGAGANPFSKKETVGFHAKTSIKRSDFGMTMGVPMIGDKVDLDISVAFEK